jgi:hypothetical protein
MQAKKLNTYNDLINWHVHETRALLTKINPSKTATYWANIDTFYYRYQDNDILYFWGTNSEIKQLS